jgi:hypothetical protein
MSCVFRSLRGSSKPSYKGAWLGHHNGSGAVTLWSPRLTHELCLLQQLDPPYVSLLESAIAPAVRESAMGLQQLGRPIRP